ncbi:MAG: response regulator [Verrucomicrobia bacterium]|nr:response regulator [Verrucomicrobiota bacterium]
MTASPIKVLLIDDEPAQAWLVREYLNSATANNIELVWADCLAEGLKRLAAGEIEVVLLDLSLPDSFGANTFAKAHAQFPMVPIVVLTNLEDEEAGVQLVQAGAQDYLVKGQINAQVLYRTVRHAIERKRAADEREQLIHQLQKALAEVKTLSGMLPICSGCKKIRDDKGYWNRIETYVMQRSTATFTHGLCPDCIKKYFPDYDSQADQNKDGGAV